MNATIKTTLNQSMNTIMFRLNIKFKFEILFCNKNMFNILNSINLLNINGIFFSNIIAWYFSMQLRKKTHELTKACQKHYELEQELAFYKIDHKFEVLSHPKLETPDSSTVREHFIYRICILIFYFKLINQNIYQICYMSKYHKFCDKKIPQNFRMYRMCFSFVFDIIKIIMLYNNSV